MFLVYNRYGRIPQQSSLGPQSSVICNDMIVCLPRRVFKRVASIDPWLEESTA